MSTSYFIPRSDAEFDLWVKVFIACLVTNGARLNLPAEVITELQALLAIWEAKFAVAENPATATKAATREKNEAREALETKVRAVNREYLMYNHLLTDADRENMGLPIHKTTHTPVPAPTTIPEFTVDTSVIRNLKINFRDAGSSSKAKPDGVHGAEIRWNIQDAMPASIDELGHSSFDTHTPFTLAFDENQRGKSVYFCLRWENAKGDKGPWSEIVKAIIP